MSSDAALRSQYNSIKAKRDRYKKVVQGIENNNLNYKRSTSEMDEYINYIDDITQKIDSKSGYFYIENNELNTQIASLQSQMDEIRTEYNKDKKGFDRLGIDENWAEVFGGFF